MKLLPLAAKRRESDGKGPARRTRRTGQVPTVLYGEKAETVALMVDSKEFYQVLHTTQGEHALIQLEVKDASDLNSPAMVKDVQHDPVTGEVLHADFLRIDLNKKIHTVVPVVLEGRPKGVQEGGVIDHQMREVEVECLALDVPEFLSIDVSELLIGDVYHVSDLKIPENVDLITLPERALVTVLAPRIVVEETAEEDEAAEPEEIGKEGEGEEEEEGAKGEKSEKKSKE